MNNPGLFGLNNSNRDFSNKEAWGKNQFNSSLPAALCCYLAHKNTQANYLSIRNGKFNNGFIDIKNVFGIKPNSNDIYFAFEAQHTPYQKFVVGPLPRTDLVIQNYNTGECISALEVKLTALPDNATCNLNEKLYGSELVIRPDTITYLACSIATSLNNKQLHHLPDIKINDWSDIKSVLIKIDAIINSLEDLSLHLENKQNAIIVHPIWKTVGKSPELAEDCLDVFIWSNAAFINFISKIANKQTNTNGINRQTRAAVWLYKMLIDIKNHNKFNHSYIYDNLTYNRKNDKAFASSGTVTNQFMYCPRLIKPAIKKSEIKNIILGGGQNLLSPERRFDAILFNSPDLFI